jgi:hypothetical protein|tara:strand:- start:2263 stop:2637 length:375 start_codon:yes stop_codon:yes gene_type:complete
MAAPNIVNVATITAKTDTALLSGTSAVNALNNPASSGKVMKVNSLVISNVDASAAATITIGIYPQDDIGGTAVIYANAVSVAPNSFLVAIDKDVGMYLEEDTSLGVTASAANDLTYTITYEELS